MKPILSDIQKWKLKRSLQGGCFNLGCLFFCIVIITVSVRAVLSCIERDNKVEESLLTSNHPTENVGLIKDIDRDPGDYYIDITTEKGYFRVKKDYADKIKPDVPVEIITTKRNKYFKQGESFTRLY